ncbi:SGNH/GDSL hydrolase family protein [Massilia forsythiae]|uniref:SGNH/GDSL hydrolase family protein n=1 Tax=Massilia forsythiae TaxID=2728020 RepID=A0A7Z2VZM6_9BURK|nr:SGNH/GDSL hydrolase family protein [Massilia forsythiae]QJE02088.1 SGNH/GDSL hydrolase family protein [Massilia forsythiae]
MKSTQSTTVSPLRAGALALLAAGLLHAGPALAGTAVAPSDKRLQYTGRIDFSRPSAPVLSWPGSAIAGNFTGSSLSVTLDDQNGKNYFNVFLDGDLTYPFVLEAFKGEKTYLVAQHLAPGRHSFLITKRTEGEEGATTVRGFELADGGQLLAPPPRPARRIEFFGDSITSGMGDEGADNGRDDRQKDKNNFMSYASIAARQLGAEAHVTSQSGIGLMISWFPFTMPDFYDQLSAVGDNDSKWDFSSWTPDVVVVNLFQNDAWLVDREHRLKPEPTPAQRIEAYRTFVARIRQLYPKAYIVCALGSMDATKADSPWPGYVTAAVERLRKEDGEKRIDTLFFDFTGYGQHPRIKQHQANAARLSAFIKGKMGW